MALTIMTEFFEGLYYFTTLLQFIKYEDKDDNCVHASGFAFGNFGKNILIRVAKSLLFLKSRNINKKQSSHEESPEFIEMLRVL